MKEVFLRLYHCVRLLFIASVCILHEHVDDNATIYLEPYSSCFFHGSLIQGRILNPGIAFPKQREVSTQLTADHDWPLAGKTARHYISSWRSYISYSYNSLGISAVSCLPWIYTYCPVKSSLCNIVVSAVKRVVIPPVSTIIFNLFPRRFGYSSNYNWYHCHLHAPHLFPPTVKI